MPLRNLDSTLARAHLFQGKKITITTSPNQTIMLDGEASLDTPGEIEIMPGALEVIVPA
jgi:diacylglycerol kinase family enzyme